MIRLRTDRLESYRSVLRRDPCAYCNGPGGTLDHIVPIHKGGKNHWENQTGACSRCNYAKDKRSLLLFLAKRNGVTWQGCVTGRRLTYTLADRLS